MGDRMRTPSHRPTLAMAIYQTTSAENFVYCCSQQLLEKTYSLADTGQDENGQYLA